MSTLGASCFTVEEAAQVLVESLSPEQRLKLASLVLNPQIAASRWCYELAITMFNLADRSSPLIFDIERTFPDEAVFSDIEGDGAGPVFEAKVIIRAAQARISRLG